MKDRSMIVVAAGSSSRFGSDKLMTEIAGRPLVVHTVTAIKQAVDKCILVARADQIAALTAMDLGVDIVAGGATRTESEAAGLDAAPPSRLIGIHDGARPAINPDLIDQLFEAASVNGGAVPGLPPRPLLEREGLAPVHGVVAVQTPQVFRGPELISAYESAQRASFIGHDTVDVVSRFTDLEIVVIPGDPDNVKVTHPEDMERVREALTT